MFKARLGAVEVLDRALFASPGKPLAKECWAGAIDVAGSHTLANVCASTRYRGIVAACGLAAGLDFPATVAPFILRGITLAGVDSVMCPRALGGLAPARSRSRCRYARAPNRRDRSLASA